jgi:hypothetical protein
MSQSARLATFAYGILALGLAWGFFVRASWATRLWPWSDGRLSFIFLSSIVAATALGVLWTGISRDLATLQPIAMNGMVATLGLAGTFLFVAARDSNGRALAGGILMLVVALSFVAILVHTYRIPFRDQRPIPNLLRYSFLLFVVSLTFASAALFFRAPHIFPWPLKHETSVVAGWFFLGSAVYFAHAYLRPVMGNVYAQLLAFLAYDLILIVPFLRHFDNVAPAHRLSLVVYTGVVIYSGLLAIYYLALDPSTRIPTTLEAEAAPAESGLPHASG